MSTTTADVAYACYAVTEGVVTATGVACSLRPVGSSTDVDVAASRFAPGNASATGNVAKNVPLQPYNVCFAADYILTNGQHGGGGGAYTISGCKPASLT